MILPSSQRTVYLGSHTGTGAPSGEKNKQSIKIHPFLGYYRLKILWRREGKEWWNGKRAIKRQGGEAADAEE